MSLSMTHFSNAASSGALSFLLLIFFIIIINNYIIYIIKLKNQCEKFVVMIST
jgi:hypothetical protein